MKKVFKKSGTNETIAPNETKHLDVEFFEEYNTVCVRSWVDIGKNKRTQFFSIPLELEEAQELSNSLLNTISKMERIEAIS